jgi:hypothetical protein
MTMRWWVAIALLVCMPFRAHAAQLCEDVLVGMQPASNGIAETPIYQQQCRWVAGAVAFNTYTRAFSSAWNYENADDAFAEVRRSCGMDCAAFSFFEDLAWVAISEDDKHYGTSTVSAKEAMRECGSYGHPCELVIGASSTAEAVYWTFGAVAYDVATGHSGKSWALRRRRDAATAAVESCAADGCWAYAFQGGYGAIAKSKSGQLFGAWDESGRGLLSSASKEAKKACKKATSEKDCEIVVKGSAHSE